MKKQNFAAIASAALVVVIASTGALANTGRLSAGDISKAVIGKRIYLAVPLGGEFPLNYYRSGAVDGTGEALGLGQFTKPDDKGKWWIDGDRLCQQFTTWYKGEAMCFELYETGDKRLKWIRNNGDTGTARIGGAL